MQHLRCNVGVIRGDLPPSNTAVTAGRSDESEVLSAEGLDAFNNRAIIQLRHRAASQLKRINSWAIFTQKCLCCPTSQLQTEADSAGISKRRVKGFKIAMALTDYATHAKQCQLHKDRTEFSP